MNLQALGIPWYSAETYDLVKAMSEDADGWHDTFDEWLAQASRAQAAYESSGMRVIRVHVVPAELLAFCRARDANVNAHSRADFAAHQTYLMDQERNET